MTCRDVTIMSQRRHFEFEAATLNPKPAVIQLTVTSPKIYDFVLRNILRQNKHTKVKISSSYVFLCVLPSLNKGFTYLLTYLLTLLSPRKNERLVASPGCCMRYWRQVLHRLTLEWFVLTLPQSLQKSWVRFLFAAFAATNSSNVDETYGRKVQLYEILLSV